MFENASGLWFAARNLLLTSDREEVARSASSWKIVILLGSDDVWRRGSFSFFLCLNSGAGRQGDKGDTSVVGGEAGKCDRCHG